MPSVDPCPLRTHPRTQQPRQQPSFAQPCAAGRATLPWLGRRPLQRFRQRLSPDMQAGPLLAHASILFLPFFGPATTHGRRCRACAHATGLQAFWPPVIKVCAGLRQQPPPLPACLALSMRRRACLCCCLAALAPPRCCAAVAPSSTLCTGSPLRACLPGPSPLHHLAPALEEKRPSLAAHPPTTTTVSFTPRQGAVRSGCTLRLLPRQLAPHPPDFAPPAM